MRSNLADLIAKGIKLAYRRMLEEKSKNNEDLVICEKGKIIRIKAKDVLKDLSRKGEL